MLNLEMWIYTEFDGAETRVTWASEEEYQAVRKFLQDNGAAVMDIASNVPTAREMVYVENVDQLNGLTEFVRSLREKAQS